MSMLFRVAERALNRPLLILPDKVPLILAVLEGRIPLAAGVEAPASDLSLEAAASLLSPSASRFVGSQVEYGEDGRPKRGLPYRLTEAGVAVVTVTGSLVNRGAWLGASSGLTSYEGVGFQIESARRADNVGAIVLDVESPGGEGQGAFEIAAAVRAAAADKPVYAVVNGVAASAAYALVSGATRIVTIPSGVSGSIGVVMVHADYSRKLDRDGVTPTLIFSGAHKVDANSLQPLPKEVKADLQAWCDEYYELFIETVAAGRKGLTPEAIRATEAEVFTGREAVSRGLADEIGTFDDVLAELSTRAASERRSQPQRGTKMTTMTAAPGATTTSGIPEAEHERLVGEARTAGAATERARVKSILTCDESRDRSASAMHLALETDLSLEAAKGVLAGLPVGAPAAAAGPAAQRAQNAPDGLVTATGDTNPKKVASSWGDAVDRTNRRAGAR